MKSPYLTSTSVLIALAILLSQCKSSTSGAYQVEQVSDGDTITVISPDQEELKVRFACVDAPEVPHSAQERNSRNPADRNQYEWGDRARARLTRLLQQSNNQVLLTITATDSHSRHVAEVRLPDGTFVQEVLTEEGLVMAFRRYYDDCPSSQQIDQAEAKAKRQNAGLWSDRRIIPPWEFRTK